MSAAPLAPPILLDALDEAPGDRVDHGWAPELIRPASVPAGSLAWLAGGLMLLAVGWIGLSMLDFMHEQFARSDRLGYFALAICLAAAGLVLRGVLIEVRAYGALLSVEAMRTALSRFDVPLSDAKRLSTTWLDTVSARLPNPESVHNSIKAASDLPELRAILRSRVLTPLDQVRVSWPSLARCKAAPSSRLSPPCPGGGVRQSSRVVTYTAGRSGLWASPRRSRHGIPTQASFVDSGRCRRRRLLGAIGCSKSPAFFASDKACCCRGSRDRLYGSTPLPSRDHYREGMFTINRRVRIMDFYEILEVFCN